jgi:ankyrin repeat protein
MLAAVYGDVEITNILLENGANVNTRTYYAPNRREDEWIRDDGKEKYSVLIVATINRHLSIAELLLKDKRINVNFRAQCGATALMMAVLTKQIELVQLLIKYGANVNMELKSRHTALDLALGEMCFPIAKLLIENNARIRIRFSQTNTTKYDGLLEKFRLGVVQYFSKCYERTSRIINKIWCSVFVWFILFCGFLLYFFELHAVYICP